MRIRADFSTPVTVFANEHIWVKSPQPGVERVMLDRIGAEKARATSLVRYEAASQFPRHLHPGGEEILVLSGVFSDEHGDYPEGFYLRNPPGSCHEPSSSEGTLIFVKLWQMYQNDQQTVRLDTRDPSNWIQEPDRDVCLLYRFDAGQACGGGSGDGDPKFDERYEEQVVLMRLQPGAALPKVGHFAGGAEILVVDGCLRMPDASLTRPESGSSAVSDDAVVTDTEVKGHTHGEERDNRHDSNCTTLALEKGAWSRIPVGGTCSLIAGEQGATCYVKTGHLVHVLPAG